MDVKIGSIAEMWYKKNQKEKNQKKIKKYINKNKIIIGFKK